MTDYPSILDTSTVGTDISDILAVEDRPTGSTLAQQYSTSNGNGKGIDTSKDLKNWSMNQYKSLFGTKNIIIGIIVLVILFFLIGFALYCNWAIINAGNCMARTTTIYKLGNALLYIIVIILLLGIIASIIGGAFMMNTSGSDTSTKKLK